ncbi:hypothetical protein T440DRAFT_445934 [Plenodomus tracheiphilus IPT5]|uniref:Uncharacterized protein n=1 Tax=Plenodomus tracheiphilus IPT5 TaxID=1408161 RepID=A0A6A7BBW3_9PLEO|nr:hypothetical protein T440DRAFT_445934 [Plenodomus tracheiphilus IPT5]
MDPNLDLAKILATLANLPKPDPQSYEQQPQEQNAGQSYPAFQDPAHAYPIHPSSAYDQSADPRLVGRRTPQHRQPAPKPQERSSTPLIDPSTITEWKQGLRCVSKLAVQNPYFVAAVRKLMKDQEQNVRAWAGGRARLIEDHRFKRENEQTHRAALSLPGLLTGTALLRTPEREKEELDEYDAKVYRASKAMVESQTSALKVLGVPFFGTKPYLVVQSEEPLGPDGSEPTQLEGKITKEQLLGLQRKMLNHLMELYGD